MAQKKVKKTAAEPKAATGIEKRINRLDHCVAQDMAGIEAVNARIDRLIVAIDKSKPVRNI